MTASLPVLVSVPLQSKQLSSFFACIRTPMVLGTSFYLDVTEFYLALSSFFCFYIYMSLLGNRWRFFVCVTKKIYTSIVDNYRRSFLVLLQKLCFVNVN